MRLLINKKIPKNVLYEAMKVKEIRDYLSSSEFIVQYPFLKTTYKPIDPYETANIDLITNSSTLLFLFFMFYLLISNDFSRKSFQAAINKDSNIPSLLIFSVLIVSFKAVSHCMRTLTSAAFACRNGFYSHQKLEMLKHKENINSNLTYAEIIKNLPLPNESKADDIPENYCCSISKEIMTRPVRININGIPTGPYDGRSLLEWIESRPTDVTPSNPLTGEPLNDSHIIEPDQELSQKINAYILEKIEYCCALNSGSNTRLPD